MFKQRKAYLAEKNREHFEAKFNLQQALVAMERAVGKQKIRVLTQEESALRIQRAVRSKLNRLRFKKALYKFMKLKDCLNSAI